MGGGGHGWWAGVVDGQCGCGWGGVCGGWGGVGGGGWIWWVGLGHGWWGWGGSIRVAVRWVVVVGWVVVMCGGWWVGGGCGEWVVGVMGRGGGGLVMVMGGCGGWWVVVDVVGGGVGSLVVGVGWEVWWVVVGGFWCGEWMVGVVVVVCRCGG